MFHGIGIFNKSLSNFLQTRRNIIIVRMLGIRASRMLISLQGFIYFLFHWDEFKAILKGSKYLASLNPCSDNFFKYYKNIFCGIFDHYCEKLIMGYWPLKRTQNLLKKKMQVKNKKHLDKIVENGRGAILVTGHYGGVEFLPLALNSLGYKIAMICKFKTTSLKRELYKRAEYLGILLINADEPNVAVEALKAIKDGRILITECDEFKKWRKSKVEIDVFSKRMQKDTTLDLFYRRAKVSAVFGVIKREFGCNYTLCIESLLDAKEKKSLSEVSWRTLENYIYKYPYQWYQWKDFALQVLKTKESENVKENTFVPVTNTFPAANYS